MNRDQFLTSIWKPYPAVTRPIHDVAAHKAGARGLVGGRLIAQGEKWILSSAGESVEVRFTPNSKWVSFTEQERAPFSTALLVAGDVVCVTIADHEIVEVELLSPSSGKELRESRFSVGDSLSWAEFLTHIRTYFTRRGFIEALTPTLVPSPGTEPYLDAFETSWEMGSRKKNFYLPTSPEFHLKKMLVRGWTRIFEMKPCFRNGEVSDHHQPEFLMLEWYRAYSNLDAIADDVEGLIESLTAWVGLPQKLERTTMAKLFAEYFNGFKLSPETSLQELNEAAAKAGMRIDPTDTWDELFLRLFVEKIEPHLGKVRPLLVRGYPPSQAALSRIGEDGFADRFEVYWKGLELANAFHELNDPHENRKRFNQDNALKVKIGKPQVKLDQELIEALDFGLPPSGGIALGVDRLFMALFNIANIQEARAFPFASSEEEDD